MAEITGGFNIESLQGGANRVVEIPTETARTFFNKIALKKTDLLMNDLGIYSFVRFNRFGKARMAHLKGSKHLLQSRKNCATWNPKGKWSLGTDEITSCPIEFMAETCADSFFGDCLEYLLGQGNDVWNILATPEGREMFNNFVERVYLDLGNSFFDFITWSNNSLIADAESNAWYDTENQTDQDWTNFKDQNQSTDCKGHITLIDELQAKGYDHFNVQIADSDLSTDGKTYTGDAKALFASMRSEAMNTFKTAIKRRTSGIGTVILVSSSIYDKYEEQIIEDSITNSIASAYQYYVTRNGIQEPQDGVLLWKGIPVVCMDDWSDFDNITGTTTHRAVMSMQGNMWAGWDVDNLNQFGGLGMRVQQRFDLPHKGEIYMHSTLKAGAGISDHEFMVNASKTVTPS